jgi:AraC-like DNA-binding protein
LIFEERKSDSPLVETIWRTQSECAASFISLAASHWEMVLSRHNGNISMTVRGPETRATLAYCPADAEFFGIVFKLGAFMPHLPLVNLRDRRDATLPGASSKSFWLYGSAWQFPDYDNADTFVEKLVRENILVRDGFVEVGLQDLSLELSVRTLRRRFLRATGLTHKTIQQIERARHAMVCLQQGVSILDTAYEAGYFDQPHMNRSLKRFVGQTPAQIAAMNGSEQMSLLYKTETL